MEDKVNVLIIEDEPLILLDIEIILKKIGYHVVGTARNSDKALDLLANRSPDIVLLDIRIEGSRDGIYLAQIINEKYKLPFLFITSHSDERTLDRAKETNPSGYIVKPFNKKDLKTSIAIALHNYSSANQKKEISKENIDKHCNRPLSPKEYDIAVKLVKGLEAKQIAIEDGVSYNTIKYHIKNIYTKMEVSAQSELLLKVMS